MSSESNNSKIKGREEKMLRTFGEFQFPFRETFTSVNFVITISECMGYDGYDQSVISTLHQLGPNFR